MTLVEYTLEIGTCVHPRGAMALVEDKIAGMAVGGTTKKVVHSHVVKRGAGAKT